MKRRAHDVVRKWPECVQARDPSVKPPHGHYGAQVKAGAFFALRFMQTCWAAEEVVSHMIRSTLVQCIKAAAGYAVSVPAHVLWCT